MVNSTGLPIPPPTASQRPLLSSSPLQKRESRHILVQGLPAAVNNERLCKLFGTFGRVQKIDYQPISNLVIISFYDRHSARKALGSNLQIDGSTLQLSFCELKSAYAAQNPSTSPPSAAASLSSSHAIFVSAASSQQYLVASNANLESVSVESAGNTAHTASRRSTNSGSAVGKQLQGVSISQLPAKVAESALKQQLTDLLLASRSTCRLIDISFEHAGDATRALLLLQNVSDLNLLLAEFNQHSLPAMAGQRLRARSASQEAVNEAYNYFLTHKSSNSHVSNSFQVGSSFCRADPTSINPSSSYSTPDPRQKDACRTLYVGNLDKNCKEHVLRSRFLQFGHIIDVDIKNKESFAPFAFVQFANIKAVVAAIIKNQANELDTTGLKNSNHGKLKVNFGKAMLSTKLWIGGLPPSCSYEYLLSRLRGVSPDGVQEVNYDATNNEALVIFKNVEQAQLVFNQIKSRLFVIPPEKPQKDSQCLFQQVDFASDKLHDFFVDRKFGRIRASDLIISNEGPISTSSQAISNSRKSQEPDQLRQASTSRVTEKLTLLEAANAPHVVPTTVHAADSDRQSSESLLAPPPDPPQNLLAAEVTEELDSMSSRHNIRRSSSRRSSPDPTRHRRDRDRDRYERRSDSRAYMSRYRDNKHDQKRRSEPRHESRHHRNQSSSSSSSSSSGSSRSSMSLSSSSISNNSNSPKNASRMPQNNKNSSIVMSPTISTSALMPVILGHPPFSQPPPPIPPIKNPNLPTPLKRSDTADSMLFPSTSSLGSPERTRSQTVSQKTNNQVSKPPSSSSVVAKSEPKASTSSSSHFYRSSYTRPPALLLQSEPDRHHHDPRPLSDHYSASLTADLEPTVVFPAFYHDDELGKQYCQRVQTLIEPRNAQALLTSSIRPKNGPDFLMPSHPPVSRSSSGSDYVKTPAQLIDLSVGHSIFDTPLVLPYPPPPLGTPLEPPGLAEVKQKTDPGIEHNSFTERLQFIKSKVSSISEKHHQSQSVGSSVFHQRNLSYEEDLQRLKFKKAQSTKSCDSSQSTTPTSRVSDGPRMSIGASSRLTINIPTSASNSSTPNVESPAPHHQLTPGSTTNLSAKDVQPMPFTPLNSHSVLETPLTTSTGLAPRSASYSFTTSPASSLPLPPQPPTLQTTSPKTDKIVSPRLNPAQKSVSLISPTVPHSSLPSSASGLAQVKSEAMPAVNIKSTAVTKSAVTSPLTTPSTPRSAASMPSADSKVPSVLNRENNENTEEARRKKQDEKMKLFQSMKFTKKPRDSNPVEEIFSFSSPLSRISHVQQQQQHQTNSHAPLNSNLMSNRTKPAEKPAAKSFTGNQPVNRSLTQSNLQKNDKKSVKPNEERQEKLKSSKSFLSMMPSKTDNKQNKSAPAPALNDKNRRASTSIDENVMKKIREKAVRKFPNDEKERDKYVRRKQERLRQHAEEIYRQKDKQKDGTFAKKSADENQRKLQPKTTEQRSSALSKTSATAESSKEKEAKAVKEKPKEQRESVERNKQQKQTVGRKKRQRAPSESEAGSDGGGSEEENSSEILAECGLKNIDLEMQRILFEEAKSGQLNLSMYERVRRRRMIQDKSDDKKKSQALEMLRENKKKKPKRVQLSSDEDADSNAASNTTSNAAGNAASNATDSQKPSVKQSVSDNSESENSDATSAVSSSDALQRKGNGKKLSKVESKKKDKQDKRKKNEVEKPTVTKKLSIKKLPKKEAGESDSDARSNSSKPQKQSAKADKKVSAESSEDSNDEMIVKKLKKNLSAYNNDSDESETETVMARGRPKKKPISKVKPKKSSALLDEEDFCADSDDDRRSSEKKEVIRIYTGKPGRPCEKVKIVSDKPCKTGKVKSKKQEDSEKDVKKTSKKVKQEEEDKPSDVPSKKLSNSSAATAKNDSAPKKDDKKRRASSEIEDSSSVKRQKSEKASLLKHLPKMSPTIEEFSFAQISPTQSTGTDSVRLENFVTQNCEPSSLATPLISPLGSSRFVSGSAENETTLNNLLPRRCRTPSSSSSASVSSTVASTTSVATSTTKKSNVSRQLSDSSSKASEITTKLCNPEPLKPAQDPITTRPSSVAEQSEIVKDKKPSTPLNLIAESQPKDEPSVPVKQSPYNGNQEESDDEMDYEAMLVSKLNQKDVPPKTEEKVEESNALISQETEDAVESILMNTNHQRSEDEEDEVFSLISHAHGNNQATDLPAQSNAAQLLSPKIEASGNEEQSEGFAKSVPPPAATDTRKNSNSTQSVHSPDAQPVIRDVEEDLNNGKISPISSVVESIAHGTTFSINNVAISTPASEQKPAVLTATAANPPRASTPPLSRSTGGSPVAQVQYPVKAQSPAATPKPAEVPPTPQSIESAPKRMSDGSIKVTPVSTPTVSVASTPAQAQVQLQSIQETSPVVSQPPATKIPRLNDANAPMHLPCTLAQIQQQLTRRSSMNERELLALASEMIVTKQQAAAHPGAPQSVTAPSMSMPASFVQPIPSPAPTQQRSRAGSQSTGRSQTPSQRKSGAAAIVSTQQTPQQLNAPRNVVTTTTRSSSTFHAPAVTTNTPAVVSSIHEQIEPNLSTLNQILGVNPALNNTMMMQQLFSSPHFLNHLPQLAAHPQDIDSFLRKYPFLYQAGQPTPEQEKVIKQVIAMANSNPSTQVVNQVLMTLYQQEQSRQQQEQEFAEKQKQLMLTQYETACREKQTMAEDVVRRQTAQQRLPANQQEQQQPVAPVPASQPLTTLLSTTRRPPSRIDEARYPVFWQGNLALKNNEIMIQMHHVSGNHTLFECTYNELATQTDQRFPTFRITQRMQLRHPHMLSMANRMNDAKDFVALACFPCGESIPHLIQETSNMINLFIDYFTAKMSAGVVGRAPNFPHPTCVAHVFPPCEFTVDQLKRFAPDMFEQILVLKVAYLFVVITRNDFLPDNENVKVDLPVISDAVGGKTI